MYLHKLMMILNKIHNLILEMDYCTDWWSVKLKSKKTFKNIKINRQEYEYEESIPVVVHHCTYPMRDRDYCRVGKLRANGLLN